MNMHQRLSSMKKMVLNCRKELFVCIVNALYLQKIGVELEKRFECILYNFRDTIESPEKNPRYLAECDSSVTVPVIVCA